LFFDDSLKDVMEKHLLNDTKATKDQPLLINEDAITKVQHVYYEFDYINNLTTNAVML
jgi:hypothetical protein